MTVDSLQLFFDIFQFLLLGGIGLYSWRANRDRAQREEVDAIAQRLTVIEQDIKHMPGHDHLQSLATRMEDLHRDVASISGGMEGIRRAVDLINEHLLNRRGQP